jgi:hypothetical protein
MCEVKWLECECAIRYTYQPWSFPPPPPPPHTLSAVGRFELHAVHLEKHMLPVVDGPKAILNPRHSVGKSTGYWKRLQQH